MECIYVRHAAVYEEHAQLAGPDGKHRRLFRYKHPLASNNSILPGLWGQGRYLLGGHEIRAPTEDDSVDGYDQEGVPNDALDHGPIIRLESLDAELANPCRAADHGYIRVPSFELMDGAWHSQAKHNDE